MKDMLLEGMARATFSEEVDYDFFKSVIDTSLDSDEPLHFAITYTTDFSLGTSVRVWSLFPWSELISANLLRDVGSYKHVICIAIKGASPTESLMDSIIPTLNSYKHAMDKGIFRDYMQALTRKQTRRQEVCARIISQLEKKTCDDLQAAMHSALFQDHGSAWSEDPIDLHVPSVLKLLSEMNTDWTMSVEGGDGTTISTEALLLAVQDEKERKACVVLMQPDSESELVWSSYEASAELHAWAQGRPIVVLESSFLEDVSGSPPIMYSAPTAAPSQGCVVTIFNAPLEYLALVLPELMDVLAGPESELFKGACDLFSSFFTPALEFSGSDHLWQVCSPCQDAAMRQKQRKLYQKAVKTIQKCVNHNLHNIKARLWRPDGRLHLQQVSQWT